MLCSLAKRIDGKLTEENEKIAQKGIQILSSYVKNKSGLYFHYNIACGCV